MKYKVIAELQVSGQLVRRVYKYDKLENAQHLIEILKQYGYSNIKLIKEQTIQEVIEEWQKPG